MKKFLMLRQKSYRGIEVEGDFYCLLAKSMVDQGFFDQSEVWIGGDESNEGVVYESDGFKVRLFRSLENTTDYNPDVLFTRGGYSEYIPVLERYKDAIKIYWCGGKNNVPVLPGKWDIILYTNEKLVPQFGSSKPVKMLKGAAEVFHPLEEEKIYDLCYVANINRPVKNHKLLLDALRKIDKRLKVILVGETHDCLPKYPGHATEMLKIARSLDHNISTPGHQAKEEVNRIMNQSKFGIICSEVSDSPRVLVEYLAAGIPVLCNKNLMDYSYYINNDTGAAFYPKDFADGIKMMHESYSKYNPHGYFKEHFTIKRITRRLYEEIYSG